MIHRTTSIVIVLALSNLMLPTAAGERIQEEDYTAGCCVREGVTGENLGLGLVLFPNHDDSCYCYGPDPIGGVRLWPYGSFDHFELLIDDAIFGQPPSSVCFYNPAGDGICGEDDYAPGMTCGDRFFADVPIASEDVTVFLYAVYLTPSLDACVASTGTVTATFS